MRILVRIFLLAIVLGCCGTQGQVINELDDVTVCEGREAVLTCVLNSNIGSDDVQWYRFIKDTSATEMVDPNGDNIYFITDTIENITSSSLTISNVLKAYTGYFWVGIPSPTVCNVSLTVLTSPISLTVNIMKIIENSSIVIQWDVVDDSLITTYTVTWIRAGGGLQVATLIEQTSYTITGLTLDTVYIIKISAANTCGTAPEFITNVSLSSAVTSTLHLTATISTMNNTISSTGFVTRTTNAMPTKTTDTAVTTVITATTSSSPIINSPITSDTPIVATTTTSTTANPITATTTSATTSTDDPATAGAANSTTKTATNTLITIAVATTATTIVTTTNTTTASTSTTLAVATYVIVSPTFTANPNGATPTTPTGVVVPPTSTANPTPTTPTGVVVPPTSTANPNGATPTTPTGVVVPPTSTANPNNATSADDGSGSSVFIIVGVILAGIILVSLFFILFCFFGRKRGELFSRKDYRNLKGNGTLRNNIPMATNPLDSNDNEKTNHNQPEEINEGTNMDSQPPCTYDRLESVEKLHPPGIYDQLGAPQEPKRNYEQYDKLPMARRADIISEAFSDDGIPSRVPTVTLPSVDAHQKNDEPSVDGTHKRAEDGGVHSNVPTVTVPSSKDQTGDSTSQNPNDPALHYAVLQTLPTPTGAYMTKDDTTSPYALVTQI